jgi:hypothetical protein
LVEPAEILPARTGFSTKHIYGAGGIPFGTTHTGRMSAHALARVQRNLQGVHVVTDEECTMPHGRNAPKKPLSAHSIIAPANPGLFIFQFIFGKDPNGIG